MFIQYNKVESIMNNIIINNIHTMLKLNKITYLFNIINIKIYLN